MKSSRFFSFFIMFVFALTLLVPAPVSAQPAAPADAFDLVAAAAQKTATLNVTNSSGGTIYVALSGPKSYYFSSAKAGKVQFTGIEPGTYTIRLSASTCTEVVSVQKKFKDKLTLKETVCAKKAEKKNNKVSSLTVDNRTGGTLWVTLTGPKTYYFSTADQGKTTFSPIDPGKYTITVRSSACGGSLTYTKNISGKASLKPFICR